MAGDKANTSENAKVDVNKHHENAIFQSQKLFWISISTAGLGLAIILFSIAFSVIVSTKADSAKVVLIGVPVNLSAKADSVNLRALTDSSKVVLTTASGKHQWNNLIILAAFGMLIILITALFLKHTNSIRMRAIEYLENKERIMTAIEEADKIKDNDNLKASIIAELSLHLSGIEANNETLDLLLKQAQAKAVEQTN